MSKLSDMARRIRALEAEVKRLQPVPSPGVLTSKTTRGVSRKATATSNTTTTNEAPRWA
jgi:hypothetical protein